MNIVIVGLSITSSWGNGPASTYRALVSGLAARGHQVMFLERDVPWYAENRDLPQPPHCRVGLYLDPAELERRYREAISAADLVMVGSYVPDGIVVADLVLRTALGCTAFYDIDTPVTLAALQGCLSVVHRRTDTRATGAALWRAAGTHALLFGRFQRLPSWTIGCLRSGSRISGHLQ
jgi:spore maturation protein CgeB